MKNSAHQLRKPNLTAAMTHKPDSPDLNVKLNDSLQESSRVLAKNFTFHLMKSIIKT
jgi:hypothetical protein